MKTMKFLMAGIVALALEVEPEIPRARNSTIYICAIFIFVLCSTCNRSLLADEGPMSVSYKFIKSFVTSDTALFYATVENDSIVDHMNREVWQSNDDIYTVRRMLFFKYAPFKLPERLKSDVKEHPFPFSHFEIDHIRKDEGVIRVTARWREFYDKNNEDPLKVLDLTLYEKHPGIWKIKTIDLPMDSLMNQ